MATAGFVGANAEQLEGLARQFNVAADQIERMRTLIRASLGGPGWTGPDAEEARYRWNRLDSPKLAAAAAALRAGAQELAANAVEQRLASGDLASFAGAFNSPARSGAGLGGEPFGDRLAWGPIIGSALLAGNSVLSLGGLAVDAADLAGVMARFTGTNVNAATLRSLMANAGGATSTLVTGFSAAGFVIGAGINGYQFLSGIYRGDMGDVLEGGARLALDGAALIYPPASALKLGIGIGEALADNTQIDEVWSENVYNDHLRRSYGTTEITAAQAAEAARRYEGGGGFLNFVGDSGRSVVSSLNPFD